MKLCKKYQKNFGNLMKGASLLTRNKIIIKFKLYFSITVVQGFTREGLKMGGGEHSGGIK